MPASPQEVQEAIERGAREMDERGRPLTGDRLLVSQLSFAYDRARQAYIDAREEADRKGEKMHELAQRLEDAQQQAHDEETQKGA